MSSGLLGGVEAGGSTWVCAVGTGADDLRERADVPTTTPDETLGRVRAFFERQDGLTALGIGTFGPADVDPASPTWGFVTTTPKPGWAHTDVAGALGARGVPVGFDTDVNAAALGERRWGAAQGLDTFAYVTVGTGIGGGVCAGGELVHGLQHPELGHVRIPHDRELDPFPGSCPFHGDCLEGLASASAIEARRGRPAAELPDDDPVWALEAHYLALGMVNLICAASPQRIVLGGGVLRRTGLLERVREEVDALLAGYVAMPELVPPALGDRAGVLGALELARLALPR
jgi:fructokinase